jgi:hypothetical protein
LEILPKAIAEQIAEKHKISLPKYNRPFITERSAGLAQMGQGLGKRSTGSLFAVARALLVLPGGRWGPWQTLI